MPRFSLEKIVDSNRDDVFEIFSNFENYQRIIPQHFPSVRIRSMRGNVSVVEEHLILGELELLIMAKHVSQKPFLHEIFVIGGDAKGSQFKQEFIELEKGTKILVDVDLKFKGKMMISAMFGKNNFKEDYDKMLDNFIKIAEN
ncbi:MAG: SRPBCC family protein [Nitrosopumilus sp.]|nr:SRPBCC family protein [Nitrosopumilus sp.]MDF2422636.1 SRPBCC family protein [Nitrosopumilus sp.]MDF2423870.1 SRPBCC family protein [Nitrosopumilus sp.]MDF2425730.1 SRPBCC family protein [Nitrosopumilus sp.]MDF2426438.1 SRPBCC family protein [Nitrosopumilus sp.]